jgi:hypothetical protein
MLAVALVTAMVFFPFTCAATPASILQQDEYVKFVHTHTFTEANATRGNWTSVEKPMFPVYFNDTQIGIGNNWSIVEPLVAGHNYHVYCYGAFVNNGSLPKTDYDIYVYNPRGVQESEHTEAAGLPEHLGTRVNDTFFTPVTTGNYTFVLQNHAGESNGTQQATFMAIENIEPDLWFQTTIQGKRGDGTSNYNTSWAYEFVTESPQVEVYIKVPDTLDMYETRLYVMSDQNSLMLNNSPLPWEPGLYGNLSKSDTGEVGGYSLDSVEYRGVSYASCEYRGQDMFLSYNSTAPTTANSTKTLYHLALIGEAGLGKLDVLVKTRFSHVALVPTQATADLSQVKVGNDTKIVYVSNSTDITTASLQYTTNGWNTSKEIAMTILNRTCTATIPKQPAGTFVEYRVTANDTLLNMLSEQGNFTVKQLCMLNITAVHDIVHIGENLTIRGTLAGVNQSSLVDLQLMSALETQNYTITTLANGTFTLDISAFNATDIWVVMAAFPGDASNYPCFSNQLLIQIIEPTFLVKNGIFIGGGGFFGIVGLGLLYYIKKRRGA